jgi:hypothetical protein
MYCTCSFFFEYVYYIASKTNFKYEYKQDYNMLVLNILKTIFAVFILAS